MSNFRAEGMRSAEEMLSLITAIAAKDERVRAVILNGSRANPNIEPDVLQDFDIVYLVTDVELFVNQERWPNKFGEIMIMQTPDAMEDPPPPLSQGYTFLMQFMDGNRIDLRLVPIDRRESLEDSLSKVLLDKDGILGEVPEPSEADYLPKQPTAKEFFDCCNEFWWVSPYVAKGLWREQITYAHYMLDVIIRAQLMKMLVWYIGIETNFSVNPGAYGKNSNRYLSNELWQKLMQSYANSETEHVWDALFAAGELFRFSAHAVAECFAYNYLEDEDQKVTAYLEHIRKLPKEARAVY